MYENNFAQQHPSRARYLLLPIFFVGLLVSLYAGYQTFKPFGGPPFGQVVQVTIVEGMGQAEIAAELVDAGVIDSPFFFRVYAVLNGSGDELQAGNYSLGQGDGIRQAVDVLTAAPKVSPTVTMTLLEGWRADQIVEYLSTLGLEMDVGDFVDLVENGKQPKDIDHRLFKGLPQKRTLEGYLFPDTYEIYRDTTPEELLRLLVGTLDEKMTDAHWQKVAASDLSFYEILTLASIIEREVFDSADRRVVAGIFLQRLSDSYPLQSDATVNYVTGKKTTQPSAADLEVDSRYNTYQYKGLPPSPIASPSLDAIEAVLAPKKTDYYFFLTTPEGDTVFSKTYDEHLVNKRKYYP